MDTMHAHFTRSDEQSTSKAQMTFSLFSGEREVAESFFSASSGRDTVVFEAIAEEMPPDLDVCIPMKK